MNGLTRMLRRDSQETGKPDCPRISQRCKYLTSWFFPQRRIMVKGCSLIITGYVTDAEPEPSLRSSSNQRSYGHLRTEVYPGE